VRRSGSAFLRRTQLLFEFGEQTKEIAAQPATIAIRA